MEIKEIESRNIESILDILAKTMKNSSPEYREKYKQEIKTEINYYISHKEKSAQYAVLDGKKVVGFAVAGVAREDELDKLYFIDHANPREPLSWILLRQITIDPDHQGKGIGSLLLTAIEKRAKGLNLKGVYTGTRGRTLEFYEKNGFTIDKVYLKKQLI